MRHTSDVLVIGGGPAGSTTAALLRREGLSVTVAEREIFPRYHIGESLIPACLPILDLTGARERVAAAGFVEKHGAYFSWGGQEWHYLFNDLLGAHTFGWQVTRGDFDRILLDHARERGALVLEGTEVSSLVFDADGRPVSAVCNDGRAGEDLTVDFKQLVDASGRRGVLANQYLKSRRYHEAFRNVAIWSYWRGADLPPKAPAGGITVASARNGWFWLIPLHNGTTSVGLVLHRDDLQRRRREGENLEAIYTSALKESEIVMSAIAEASRVTDFRVEQDYSYHSTVFSGHGFFIAGDAACFVDPLLSTGVHLAMFSGLLAAACICSVLREEVSESEAVEFYERAYRHTFLRMMFMVESVYDYYAGKDSYFWRAQQLADEDYSSAELPYAFLRIVSGLEDVDEISKLGAHLRAVADKVQAQSIALIQASNAGISDSELASWQELDELHVSEAIASHTVLKEENNLNGLWVRVEPQLGLCRSEG
jgi:flavin-dependent dehydrogenase